MREHVRVFVNKKLTKFSCFFLNLMVNILTFIPNVK